MIFTIAVTFLIISHNIALASLNKILYHRDSYNMCLVRGALVSPAVYRAEFAVCDDTSANQHFSFDENNRIFVLLGVDKYCLTDSESVVSGSVTRVHLKPCLSPFQARQQWSIQPSTDSQNKDLYLKNMQWSSSAKCLAAPTAGSSAGGEVHLVPCDFTAASQGWFRSFLCQPGEEPNTALYACQACSQGYYKSIQGYSKCLACPFGALCPSTTSFTCDIGYGYNATLKICRECVAGVNYKNSTTKVRCSTCPASESIFCANTTSLTCRAGHEWNENRTGCLACNSTFYKSVDGDSGCTICPTGAVCNITTANCPLNFNLINGTCVRSSFQPLSPPSGGKLGTSTSDATMGTSLFSILILFSIHIAFILSMVL